MEEIALVCGQWKLVKKRWVFCVDESRGSRVLSVNRNMSYEEFLGMVYEDFGLEKRRSAVQLCYELSTKKLHNIPGDTPPVVVCNGRQLEGFLRQCKSGTVRLCVQIQEIGGEPFGSEGLEDVKEEKQVDSPDKRQRRDEDYYKDKAAGKAHEDNRSINPEPVVSGTCYDDAEDEDESRFDCFDDSDGASSGDEDYSKYSGVAGDENAFGEETKAEVKDEATIGVGENVGLTNRQKSRRKAKSVVDLELGDLDVDVAVGEKYEKDALENRLKIMSVVQKFDFVVDRSTPQLYIVKCWVDGCQWRIRASVMGDSPMFHIRIYESKHSCSVTERSARARQATPDILGELYKAFVGGVGAGVVPNHVGVALNLRYGLKVS